MNLQLKDHKDSVETDDDGKHFINKLAEILEKSGKSKAEAEAMLLKDAAEAVQEKIKDVSYLDRLESGRLNALTKAFIHITSSSDTAHIQDAGIATHWSSALEAMELNSALWGEQFGEELNHAR